MRTRGRRTDRRHLTRTPYTRPRPAPPAHPAPAPPPARGPWWRSGAAIGLVGTLLAAVLSAYIGIAALNEARAVSYREQRAAAWSEYIEAIRAATPIPDEAPPGADALLGKRDVDRCDPRPVPAATREANLQRVLAAYTGLRVIGSGLSPGYAPAIRLIHVNVRLGEPAWDRRERARRERCGGESVPVEEVGQTTRRDISPQYPGFVSVGDYRATIERAVDEAVELANLALEPQPWWQLW